MWGRGMVQVIGSASWHIRVLEQQLRLVIQKQVQQEWAHIVEGEGPGRVASQMRSLVGKERAERGALQERGDMVGGGGPPWVEKMEARGPPR